MDAGGWQAMKPARAAWQSGAVLAVEFDGARLRGQVRAGGRTLAAGMVIKSKTDVTNLCGCPVSRRDGALCEHSLALGLAWAHRTPKDAGAAGGSQVRTPERGGAAQAAGQAAGQRAGISASTGSAGGGRGAGGGHVSRPTTQPRTSGALVITLPPQFFDGLRRRRLALAMRPAPGDAAESASDRAVHAWIAAHDLTTVPPQVALADPESIESLLGALIGHPRVQVGGKPISIEEGGLRLPLRVAEDEHEQVANKREKISQVSHNEKTATKRTASGEKMGAGAFNDGPANRIHASVRLEIEPHAASSIDIWVGPNRCVIRSANDRMLHIINERSLLSPFFDESGKAVAKSVTLAWLAQQGNVLSEVFEVDEADARWPKVRLAPGQPQFRLVLDGTRRQLRAGFWCKYPGLEGFVLPQESPGTDLFPCAVPGSENEFAERNVAAEQSAMARLEREGFTLDISNKSFVLNGENEIIRFFAGALRDLEREWSVVWEARAQEAFRGLERFEPRFREVASGNDWLEFDLAFVGNHGSTISAADARRWLQSGGKGRLPNGKLAVLARESYEDLEEVLRDLSPRQEHGHFRIDKRQQGYLEASAEGMGVMRNQQQEMRDTDFGNVFINSEWRKILRSYQLHGTRWMLRLAQQGWGGILADEMGLGKTVQTLAVVSSLRVAANDGGEGKAPFLVVAPTSLLGNWRDEAARFSPDLDVLVVRSGERATELARLEQADLVITSYPLIVRDLEHHLRVAYRAVFLDEAGFIRNPDTQNAQAVRRLRAGARFALTGTPIENSIRDLWSIAEFVLPGYLGRRDDFRERYEAPMLAGDTAALRRLRRRMAPYWLRRLKNEVARDLPAKIEKILRCELTTFQRDLYAAIQREGVRQVDEARRSRAAGQARFTLLTALLRLRQACGDPRLIDRSLDDRSPAEISGKWSALVELLEEIRDGGHNVLIFSQFTTQLTLLEPALAEAGIDFCRLDGSSRDRDAQVAAFRDNPAKRAFLISLKAGGYGLNLTKADTIIHFDPWWNPAVEAQATDRAHRIGQDRPVTVYKLIAAGTVEDKILALQQRKHQLMESALADDTAPLMDDLDDAALDQLLH